MGMRKSTLLSLVAGVVVPQQGRVQVNGCRLNELDGAARDRFRADNIGFIYQMFNLIPYLSVVENVTLPFNAFISPLLVLKWALSGEFWLEIPCRSLWGGSAS